MGSRLWWDLVLGSGLCALDSGFELWAQGSGSGSGLMLLVASLMLVIAGLEIMNGGLVFLVRGLVLLVAGLVACLMLPAAGLVL